MITIETMLKEWHDKASQYPELRYPKMNVQIIGPFNMNREGNIMIETFVSNGNDRLTLVREQFSLPIESDIWELITYVKSRFEERCKQTQGLYIFDNNSSIIDPHKK